MTDDDLASVAAALRKIYAATASANEELRFAADLYKHAQIRSRELHVERHALGRSRRWVPDEIERLQAYLEQAGASAVEVYLIVARLKSEWVAGTMEEFDAR